MITAKSVLKNYKIKIGNKKVSNCVNLVHIESQ